MKGGKLTAKQERFIEEYLIDLNATGAAIRAGYKGKYVDRTASQLLGKSRVAEAISAARAKQSAKCAHDAAWVLKRLAENDKAARDLGELGHSNRALELIGKHRGMFVDNLNVAAGVTLEIIESVESAGNPGATKTDDQAASGSA